MSYLRWLCGAIGAVVIPGLCVAQTISRPPGPAKPAGAQAIPKAPTKAPGLDYSSMPINTDSVSHLKVAWQVPMDDAKYSIQLSGGAMAFDPDSGRIATIYMARDRDTGAMRDGIKVLAATDGKQVWAKITDSNPGTSGPGYDNVQAGFGKVVVASHLGSVLSAYDSANGSPAWELLSRDTKLKGFGQMEKTASQFVIRMEKAAMTLNPSNGQLGTDQYVGAGAGPGVLIGGTMYAQGPYGLIAVDMGSGTRKWLIAPTGSFSPVQPAVFDGVVYGCAGSYLYGVDAAAGTIRFKSVPTDSTLQLTSRVYRDGQKLYAYGRSSSGAYVVCFDVASAKELWRTRVTASISVNPLAWCGNVLLVAGDEVNALDPASGQVLLQKLPSDSRSAGLLNGIAVVDERTIAVVGFNGVSVLRPSN